MRGRLGGGRPGIPQQVQFEASLAAPSTGQLVVIVTAPAPAWKAWVWTTEVAPGSV